jgi:hypothetical protein
MLMQKLGTSLYDMQAISQLQNITTVTFIMAATDLA